MTEQEYINAGDLKTIDAVCAVLSSFCLENQPSVERGEFRAVMATIHKWQGRLRTAIDIEDEG